MTKYMKGESTMKLGEFLSTLRTKNVQVTVNDLQDELVCKIDAASYAALDDTVENRKVSRWEITGASAIKVVINDVENTNDNTGGNTDPSDPGNDPGTDPSNP